jgi:hypothetical protein
VAAEHFAENAESEHVVDIYIDPAEHHHTAVVFDQLVRNDNDSAGMAYYGAKYPSSHKEASEKIMSTVEHSLAPAIVSVGYRGPAGVDVLWNPLHFMELNMRTDAITYVKHLADRVGKKLPLTKINEQHRQKSFPSPTRIYGFYVFGESSLQWDTLRNLGETPKRCFGEERGWNFRVQQSQQTKVGIF